MRFLHFATTAEHLHGVDGGEDKSCRKNSALRRIEMKKTILPIAIFISALITAGCGSDSNSTPAVASTSTISGAVADGYLEKAQVFLDKNFNYILDEGEPNTITDVEGKYTLTVDPDDVGKYPVVALAIAGQTIDHDLVIRTLTESYLLCIDRRALSGTVNNFISPISTQIREMMETGTFQNIQQAADELRSRLGMPVGVDMHADYIRLGSPASVDPNRPFYQGMHTVAQNMANLMGGQAGQVMSIQGGRINNVDVNHYRSMMGSIFGNLSTIRAINPANPAHNAIMTQLREDLRDRISTVPSSTISGHPFMNFSSAYGHGMMGGR
jgi:hypothetical protein